MPNYAIIRIEKHTTLGTVAGVGHHLDRTRDTPNADPTRAHLNRTWDGQRWAAWGDVPRTPGSHLDAMKARLEDFQQRGGRIQKNAVIAIEAVMTASPEAFEDPQFDFEGWLQAQHDYLVTHFGAGNIVSAVLHLDEETPHVHAIVIPEIERIEKRGKKPVGPTPVEPKQPKPALAASQWVGSKRLLAEMQTSYAAAMAPFGLVRGKERSGAHHVPVSAYYAQGEALLKQVEQLTAEVAQLKPKAERLPQVERQLAEARAQLDTLQADRADLRDQLQRVRAARRADAEDLGVIRTIKEALPGVYQQVIGMAEREQARRALAEVAKMSTPDEPGPRF